MKKNNVIFLLTPGRGLWHGENTIARSGSPRPSVSGFFMPEPGRHDKASFWRVDRAEYNTSGEYAQPPACGS
jgi:hypothetical protein